MAEARNIRTWAAKAARIALVFMLVFWSSLRVEYLVAYGDENIATDDGSKHEAGELVDVLIYESTDDGSWAPLDASYTSPDDPSPISFTDKDEDMSFVAVPVWKSETGEAIYPEGYDAETGTGDAIQEITSATFVTWEVAGDAKSADCVLDESTNVLTIANASSNGVITISCSIPEDDIHHISSLDISFSVEVESDPGSEADPARIDSVDILNSQGSVFPRSDGAELKFKEGELPIEYQLGARVVVSNQSFAEDGAYLSPDDGLLSEFSQGALQDLRWAVSNDKIASISENGLLRITGKGSFTVICVAHVVATDQETSDEIEVTVGNAEEAAEDIQGASHPQNTLQIVSDKAFDKSIAGGEEVDASNRPSSSSSSSRKGSSSSTGGSNGAATGGDDASGEPTDGVTAQAEDSDTGDSSADDSDADGSSAGDADTNDSKTGDGKGDAGHAIDRTYTLAELDELDSLDFETETYTMYAAQKKTEITGYGFSLSDLLESTFADADIDLTDAPIQSLSFIDWSGRTSCTISWSDIEKIPMQVATKSYVHPNGNAASSSSSSASASAADDDDDQKPGGGDEGEGGSNSDLLENTRFRMLFNSTTSSLDANSLRWIKAIQVNGVEQKGDDDEAVSVSIDYTPVPMGIDAEFVAVPSNDISGSWNCTWEVSYDRQDFSKEDNDRDSDEKATWQVIEGENGQTYSEETSPETVGNYYRVTIENTVGSNGETHKVTSTGRMLREGSGLVLSYNPPRAGDLAIFRTSVYGYEGHAEELEYVWEWTSDGGRNWRVVAGESRPTLKIPTDPVDESGGSEGGGEGVEDGDDESSSSATLILIRARAIPPNGEPMVSNVQPLTVIVGDDDSEKGGNDDDGTADGKPTSPGGDTNPNNGAARPSAGSNAPKPNVVEIDNIVLEYNTTPVEQLDQNGTAKKQSAPQSTGMPAEIYVNDAVSEQIVEQQEAEEAALEEAAATVPGARWTQLKTLGSDDETQRVLNGNPFAPFVLPTGLGLAVAGGLEKVISFRRQIS